MIPYAICKRKRKYVEIAGIFCTFFVYRVRAQNCTIGIVAGRTREYEGMMSAGRFSSARSQLEPCCSFGGASRCRWGAAVHLARVHGSGLGHAGGLAAGADHSRRGEPTPMLDHQGKRGLAGIRPDGERRRAGV